jgi:hypothetical protein
VLFYEYFHGDNGRGVGASHQTGWTALALRCLEDGARRRAPKNGPKLEIEGCGRAGSRSGLPFFPLCPTRSLPMLRPR